MRHRQASQLCRAFPTRLQLVLGFSVLIALFVVALAVGVGQLLRHSILESALSGAEQTGQVFTELEIGPEEYERGKLAKQTPGDLDIVIEKSSTLRAATLWLPDESVAYSSNPGPQRSPQAPPEVRAAFNGETGSVAGGENGGAAERLLKIYVPITLAGDPSPRNVLELDLPYAPVQAKIDRRTKNLALVLGLGALLFYGALLPTVLRGSRALADNYEARQVPLQRRLRRAMRDHELALVFQPKVDVRSGEVKGVEALLRWQLADGSTVSPAEYIPLVEPTPVIDELTMHVFGLALHQSAEWERQGIDLDVAVNISACNLHDPGIAQRLARRTAEHGLSAGSFTLEVTESGISRSPERHLETLNALRARGFKLSIDDFGTGESSLSRLHEVEFQEVKIDRSFVSNLNEHRDPLVIAGIIDLAQTLGARVVAEGVESEAAALCLAELGCDEIQGFHVSRPLPARQLSEWLGRVDRYPLATDRVASPTPRFLANSRS